MGRQVKMKCVFTGESHVEGDAERYITVNFLKWLIDADIFEGEFERKGIYEFNFRIKVPDVEGLSRGSIYWMPGSEFKIEMEEEC